MSVVNLAPSPMALHRCALRLSQADLAARARVSTRTISRLENGETPQLATAIAVASALGVDLGVIFPLNDEDSGQHQGPREVRPGSGDRAEG